MFSENLTKSLKKIPDYVKVPKAELSEIAVSRWEALTEPEKRSWNDRAKEGPAKSQQKEKTAKLPQKRKAESSDLSDTESDQEARKRSKPAKD